MNASFLFVPTCYKTHHTNGDVNLFDLYDEVKDGHCCDGGDRGDGDGGNDSYKHTHHTNRFEIMPFDPYTESFAMPCLEVVTGRCAFELGEINLHSEKGILRWTGVFTDLNVIHTLGSHVYVAGVFGNLKAFVVQFAICLSVFALAIPRQLYGHPRPEASSMTCLRDGAYPL